MALVEQDEEHLRLLTLFHYAAAAIQGVLSLLPLIHVILGVTTLGTHCAPGECLSQIFAWIFTVLGGLLMVLGEVFAVAIFLLGCLIARRQHYVPCLVLAILECLLLPYGTILGLVTLIVLTRPGIQQVFERNRTPALVLDSWPD